MPAEDKDEFLNRLYGVQHAELVRPSDDEPSRPPERCPACGSAEVLPVQKLRGYALFLLAALGFGLAVDAMMPAFFIAVTGSIVFLIAGRWRCGSCGERWSS